MANNRMYLLCLRCLADESTELDECRKYTGKYYPGDGWNFNSEGVQEFFDKHRHADTWEMSMFGDHFTLITESLLKGTDQNIGAKREILEIVAKAAEEGRVGR